MGFNVDCFNKKGLTNQDFLFSLGMRQFYNLGMFFGWSGGNAA
jgi:hypothetical protein